MLVKRKTLSGDISGALGVLIRIASALNLFDLPKFDCQVTFW
jgi:hypothetical protein